MITDKATYYHCGLCGFHFTDDHLAPMHRMFQVGSEKTLVVEELGEEEIGVLIREDNERRRKGNEIRRGVSKDAGRRRRDAVADFCE